MGNFFVDRHWILGLTFGHAATFPFRAHETSASPTTSANDVPAKMALLLGESEVSWQ
jgi:hypothetical protein